MDDFLAPTPSPNGTGFAWGLSAVAEAFKNAMDLVDKMKSTQKPGDTLINVEATITSPYGENGISLRDTIVPVTVEKNDRNEYGYGNNSTVREQVDAALNNKK